MLPHLGLRPLNLFRCRGRYCFFQRNRNHPASEEPFQAPIRSVPVLQKNKRTEDYLFIEDADGLLACVATGAVEFHAWGSRVPDHERPDRIAFDLDLGEGTGFAAVKEAALQVRRSLAAIGLDSWAMLSGGKGVHVVLPFAPAAGWDDVRHFARTFCAVLAEAAPQLYTIALPVAERAGRIFLDYLRNQRTHTAVTPYSLRARPGSPVAAPVSWDELKEIGTAQAFNISDAAKLLKRAKSNALRGWAESEQRLPQL